MRLRQTLIFAAVVAIALAAAWYGVRLRRDIYIQTQDTHFTLDVHNAYLWGRNARMVGLFDLYDQYRSGYRFQYRSPLDYTPLRLLAVTTWQGWTERHFPDTKNITFDYAFTAPMLWGNTLAAMVAAIFVFLIIRMWVIRMDDADRSIGVAAGSFRGVVSGMIGALLFWFNPALLLNGYVWPQWDAWLLPFALAAIYLACLDWWFCAGVCLAIGASLKGQLLIAAPIMFLWPIFSLRFGAALRILAGFMLMNMAIAFPWMKPPRQALIWYCLMLSAMAVMIPFVLRWKLKSIWLISIALLALVLAWPWTSTSSLDVRLSCVGAIGLVALMRFMPFKLIPHGYALLIAGIIALMIPLFNVSTGWFTQGFEFGPNREQVLHGLATNNLPNILQTYYRWPNDAHYKVDAPLFGVIEMQKLMTIIYGICLVLCGIGAAIQYKRNDTRFLIAMFLPWLLFFLLLTQIRGRYLVWAAAMSALLAGTGVGMTLLGLIITAVSVLQMMQNQALLNRQYLGNDLPDWLAKITPLEPHLGWLLLLIAAISLFLTLSPRSRNRSIETISRDLQ